jgi:two-component system sensor histidine kinase RegB
VFEDLRQRLPADQAARMEWIVREPELALGVSRAALVQVLLSLVKNAFDASPADRPVVLEGRRADARVQLIVRDHGAGISEAVLHRAGEPFFTTKEAGRGMGLGLFLARIFAERAGGTLTLRADRGTIAVLELPLTRQPATAA